MGGVDVERKTRKVMEEEREKGGKWDLSLFTDDCGRGRRLAADVEGTL